LCKLNMQGIESKSFSEVPPFAQIGCFTKRTPLSCTTQLHL
jgi:hypothetical protein